MKLFRLLFSLALVAWVVALGCSNSPQAPAQEVPKPPAGFRFTLAAGTPPGQDATQNKVVKSIPLAQAAVDQLLARLKPLQTQADDKKSFHMREKSLPPPKTGKTVPQPFPPPQAGPRPDPVAAGPLKVLRKAPEGEVELAPHLSVTFSQPMVAVTSVAELAAEQVPVKLTPQPKGRWRWVGSQTLLFEPDPRFPMATEYQVEVPAGTASATGSKLAEAVRWTFGTPAPKLLNQVPQSGPHALRPLIWFSFDQAISQAAVLKTLKLSAGTATYPLRPASAAEIAADATLREQPKDRVVAVMPEQPLPPATTFQVVIDKGTPSAEGPRTTAAAQSYSFHTYHPLAVEDSSTHPRPLQQLYIRFNNPLDEKSFKDEMVRVSPAIPGLVVETSGNTLMLRGRTRGRVTYNVTLDPALPDAFGQTLGKPVNVPFAIEPADPMFRAEGGLFQVLEVPKLSYYTINHKEMKVRALAVTPADWEAFRTWFQTRQRNAQDPPEPPGQEVLNTRVAITAQPDEMVETVVDLKPVLPKGVGQLLVIAEPAVQPKEVWRRTYAISWVQVTRIGLDAFQDGNQLVTWANALKDGSPLSQVALELYPNQVKATTDAQGFATLALDKSATLLLARQGDDLAILPADTSVWGGGSWQPHSRADRLAWYVTDDRQMYRPGEKVHLKGWVRKIFAGPTGDVNLATDVKSISYVLNDSQGNKIGEGSVPTGALGGFELVLELPKTVNLGHTNLQLSTAGGATNHAFQVQEFRRPEFEVTASSNQSASFVGETSTATVTAAYYAGGGLPNAEVNWSVHSSQGSFSPPNWGEFTFGTWTPWWDYRCWWIDDNAPSAEYPSLSFQGRTDAAGKHTLALNFQSVEPPRPTSVSAQASVMDVNRQAWAATSTLLVHPADVYVGLKSERAFVQKGQALPIKFIVSDLDGKPVAGRSVAVKAFRLDWKRTGGKTQTLEKDLQIRQATSTTTPVALDLPSGEGGTYQVEATVTDAKGRKNQSQMTVWVAGGKVPPSRSVEQEQVTLVPDKKTYKPGETAEILVQSPFSPAQGVLTTRREGLVSRQTFALPQGTATLKVPLEEHFIPNLNVQVDVVGSAARTLSNGEPIPGVPPRPAFATGALNLAIPPTGRALKVEIAPADKALEPGGQTQLNLSLRNAAGQPVAEGDVAVIVVDESILALTGFQFSDPLSWFYPNRAGDVSDYHLRSFITLARTEDLDKGADSEARMQEANGGAAPPPAPAAEAPMRMKKAMSRDAKEESAPEPIKVRSNFNPLALFAGSVRTDAQGRAVVPIKLPDNLTRYRVVALAAAGGQQFGKGESTLVARLPLMVRPSAPRFLNFGDRAELPVVVQNQTDRPMDVQVAMRASNARFLEGQGRSLTVPPNDRVEVRFPVGTDEPGIARFQLAASAGPWADAAEISLPVWTPATTEAFATYGQIDEGAIAQPVKAPGEVFTEFGGLEVTTTSTAVAELTDAFLYLQSYPFECAEQLSSRILSVAALRDVLQAFAAPGAASPASIQAAMERDLERLKAQQNDDGGWDYWVRGKPSDPFVSLHVGHSLARARQKGYKVDSDMLGRSLEYMRTIESHIPGWYPEECKRSLRAYALYIRRLLGEPDLVKARALLAEVPVDKHPLETLGWILPTLSKDPAAAAIRKYIANRVSETASTAQFSTSYGDGNYLLLYSDRRCDAVMLEALIEDQPKNDVIPKLVRGLLDHRVAGRWGNTQENCFVLLALDKYFDTYEKVTPDFVARVWLGEGFAGEQTFKGRSTDKNLLQIPMSFLKGTQDLTISKTGPGRLYYRIGMTYAPKSLKLAPSEQGFSVERTYEAVKDNRDVKRDPDGTWRIKAGAEVRVRLSMVANSRRYHVALVDPLPAGLEPMNPALAVTGEIPADPTSAASSGSRGRYWWWFSTWYQHQNMRDERVEAFTTLLWEGVHPYTYVARATTPGVFVVPPAKAEEMYHPETFGRSASDKVIVE